MTNIYKGSDERGALMLEAIALLGLMTMMSPMVVRQTADRTAEMEEVAIAGQMKTLRDAVSSYIDSNYANIAAWANDTQVLTLNDLRPYLPASFIQPDGTLGNKLVDDYRVGIRRERPCNDVNPDGSLTDACNRWKITGLISSGTQAGGVGNELDDRRAARIATMIGADGGYIRSTQALNALFPGNPAEANRAIGAQGIWQIDEIPRLFSAIIQKNPRLFLSTGKMTRSKFFSVACEICKFKKNVCTYNKISNRFLKIINLFLKLILMITEIQKICIVR